MKILILTVGGSDKPIVYSIKTHCPDFVVFICTDDEGQTKGSRETVNGDGLVCKERASSCCGYKEKEDRPSIIRQTELKENAYRIEIVDADSPYDSYKKAEKIINKYLAERHEVISDYTCGTKSMSAGLVMASMEHPECKLIVVTGPRLDLVKVRDGMERVSKIPVNLVYVKRQTALYQSLLGEWNYVAATKVLEEVSNCGYVENEVRFERMLYMSRAFAAWDKFDYSNAVPLIDLYKRDEYIAPYNETLKKINATLDWYESWKPEEKKKPPGFMLIYDVLLNAERRAMQGKYDDAIARLYRALEMYAQFCLRMGNPRLASDDLDISLLPENCKEYFAAKRGPNNKVQIALTDDYNLLVYLKNPVGEVWKRRREKILAVLNKRNFSFLAHGMIPLTEKDYLDVKSVIWTFVKECDTALGLKENLKQARQLPQKI